MNGGGLSGPGGCELVACVRCKKPIAKGMPETGWRGSRWSYELDAGDWMRMLEPRGVDSGWAGGFRESNMGWIRKKLRRCFLLTGLR